MLRNLVLLLSMITSAGGGWWLGSWSGRDAKSALAEAEVKGKLAAAEHDKAQQALNQKIAALTDEFQRESQKLKDSQTQREKDFDAVVANRDARLAELAKVHDGNQKRLAVLQAQLAVAKTPEEREKIVEVIKEVKGEDRIVTIEVDGRMCQTVPVPGDLLAAWRGGTP